MIASHDIENFEHYRKPLIDKINKESKENNFDYKWENDDEFNDYISRLKDFLPSNNVNENWQKDTLFLEFVKNENNRIIKAITEGESNVAIGTEVAISTKLLIVGGVLSIIGIALYVHYSKNKEKEAANIKSALGKVMDKTAEIIPQPQYREHQLLLVIEAERLAHNLENGSVISKKDAEKIISNATFGYCFLNNDIEGQDVLNTVGAGCSDESVNYTTSEKVFIQFSLSAKSEIAIGKPRRLSIIDAINPNKEIKVEKIKKLQTSRVITKFYNII